MREGLRSSTVSQRRRERAGSRPVVQPVSDVGVSGDSNKVRNILPDLNSEANPSEFDSECPGEGGYARDGSECKGALVGNGVEGFAADEGIKSKAADTDGEGEVGKVLVQSCSVKINQYEQEVDGELRNLWAETNDINTEALECDDLTCYDLSAGEEMVLGKDRARDVDESLQQNTVSNHGCDIDIAACSEHCNPFEPKMEIDSAGCNVDDDSSGLQSRPVVSGCCSENVTCSMDSLGDRLDTTGQKRNVPEKDKLQAGGKVLRSRVVALDAEGQGSEYRRRKRATACQVNETELTRNDESCENLQSQSKKHKAIIERPTIEEENILLKSVLHAEEVAEEIKNDERSEFFDGQNERDDECLGRLRKKDEKSDPFNNTIDKDEAAAEVLNEKAAAEVLNEKAAAEVLNEKAAAEVLNNDISKELVVDPNKKCKVGRGRGRPRKQHNNNISFDLLKNGEDSLRVKIKQEEHYQLTDGTHKQQIGRHGSFKKRKRGRPRKIDNEIHGKKLKQDSHQPVIHNDESAPKGELKIKKGEEIEGADATKKWNKFRCGRFKKRKRGRPRKISKENDVQEPIPQDQERIDRAASPSSSLRLKRKQLVKGTRAEVKTGYSGTASPSSNLGLKVKSPSTREEKNVVRQQIVDMLKSAGWTVEYKPRQGKEYADAVYRSPEGKTHWSVTLAYRVLKQQVEAGKVENFCFTPIPEDKLSTLFRVQVRTRSDKNKPKEKSCVKLSGKCKGRKKKDGISGGEEKTPDLLSKKKPSSVRSGKQNRRRCALLVRGPGHGLMSTAEEFMAVSGKDSILSWMIECGVIPPGGKVHYRRRTKVTVEGSISRDGIHCSFCSKLHSVAQFEGHAGHRSCPMYQNLYLDNGSSLLQCQMESWNKQEESIRLGFHNVNVDDNDPNDDTCGICGDGGNLICCDGCPSTFHQSCLNILKFPSGDWHCVYCSCKYCGTAAGSVDQDNEKQDKSPSLLTCCLCDGKYHRPCAYEKDCEYGRSSGLDFCGKSCEQIYERFQRLVGVRAEVGDGYTCTLIKRPDSSLRSDALEPKEIHNMSKLAVALSVMNECFLPIIDHRSGINLMRHTLYSCGSNFKRLNFRGFFTAILEKEDEIIAAASIRIHGKELAEMPFIGTRNAYRRQGMCRRLLSGIEMALRSLAVEKLVIPAVSEVTETWTSVFGFEPLGGLGSEMRHMNIIVFPGVDMLQKPLLDRQFVGEATCNRDEKDIKPGDSCSKKHDEENGLIDIKAEDGNPSEHYERSIEALQDAEILSGENGSHVSLEPAAVDQEEGSKSGGACSDTLNNTLENDSSTPAKDEKWPADQVVLSSEEPVLEANLSLAEHDACEGIGETSKPVNTGRTVFEDHISRLAEGGPDDTAPTGCGSVANKDDSCSGHNPADVTAQSNNSCNCLKLEAELINPLENGVADLSSNSLCNGDLPTSISCANDDNNPVEEINASTCPVVHEVKGQSSTTEESLLLVTDHSIPNGAEVTVKTPEHIGSDLQQIDCKVVAQFNLEKSCNMDSGSNDLGTPVGFHAISAPEVGSK